jgi:phage major head subunit gpT-like protein
MASRFDSVWVPVLQGAFLTEYEGTVDKLWSKDITRRYDSPGEFLKLVDLGTVGAVRQLSGGRQNTAVIPYTQTLQNVVYELTLPIDVEDVRRDSIGIWESKAAEMGAKFALQIDKLNAAQIVANPTGFDGVSLFSSSHPVNGTVQSNDLTSSQVPGLATAGGTPTSPTAVDAMNAILGAATYFYTMIDESGDPINGGARQFLIVTSSPAIYASAVAAITSIQLASGMTDVLSKLDAKGYQFDVTLEPRVSGASNANKIFYIFRKDSVIKPLVWSEESGVEMTYLGDGTDSAVYRNEYVYAAKAVRTVGPGRYQHAARCTLS